MNRNNVIIKNFARQYDLEYKEIAELLNYNYQSFVNKINRLPFDLNELIKIVSSRDAQIAIVKDGKIIYEFGERDIVLRKKPS